MAFLIEDLIGPEPGLEVPRPEEEEIIERAEADGWELVTVASWVDRRGFVRFRHYYRLRRKPRDEANPSS